MKNNNLKKIKTCFLICLEGKKEWNCWPLPYNFWLKRFRGITIGKKIINTITQIRDKTTNATQDQIEF